jgi:hypothetical protein
MLGSFSQRGTKLGVDGKDQMNQTGEDLLTFGPAMQEQNVPLLRGDRLEMVFAERRQAWSWKPNQLGWLRLADTLDSFRWLVNHPLCGFVEIECAAFAVGLYRHRDGRLSSISRVGVEHRLLPRAHAIQEVHHVGFARLALDLDLNPIAEPGSERFPGNFLRNNGEVLGSSPPELSSPSVSRFSHLRDSKLTSMRKNTSSPLLCPSLETLYRLIHGQGLGTEHQDRIVNSIQLRGK